MKAFKTQVIIIGAGPAGLLLSRLLCQAGIHCVLIEKQTPEYVKGRIRAGVLEAGAVKILQEAGVGERLAREGIIHEGFELGFNNRFMRIDLKALTDKSVTVYGQTEITKDLMEARMQDDSEHTFYSASDVHLQGVETNTPEVSFEKDGVRHSISGRIIAGCDGFYGVCRAAIPQHAAKTYERSFDFGWLGLLSDTPPVSDELIYSNHPEGFVLCSMRSKTRSRYYIQCKTNEDLKDWSDERFWKVLKHRLGREKSEGLQTGVSIEKSIAPLRSFLIEPMSFGNLYLAGDAAHIVPPTGAKGLNLAISDVKVLAESAIEFFRTGSKKRLESYSKNSLSRVWKSQKFSWYMSHLLHQFDVDTEYEKRMQQVEFDMLCFSETAAKNLAENYVGLPIEGI